jgi:inorganic triphosphatase YgiF
VTKADQVEHELKLGAWPEFVLPDLNGFVDGAKPGTRERHDLDAIYYDTPDLKLLRRGATLRFRRGEPPGDVWTAKLPSDASAQGLARREITVTGRRDAVPKQFADLTRGWALGRALRPVARVSTLREAIPLCDDGGRVLATMDDDTVTVRRGRRVVARFRELEVELVGDASADLLSAIDERLRAAGAEHVEQIPKLTRALGREAALPWDLDVPPLGSKPTMAQAAQAGLRASVAQLVDLHALLVLDADGSARRAHAVVQAVDAKLDAFAPLLEPETISPVHDGLRRLAGRLARVAELDALLAGTAERRNGDERDAQRTGASERRRDDDLDALLAAAAERRDVRQLSARVEDARSRAHSALLRSLRDRRYLTLLQRLAESATNPPQESDSGRRRVAAAAGKFVRPLWRDLRQEGAPRLAQVARVEAAVELVAPAVGTEAETALERMRELRALLDERDHALALEQRLRAMRRRLDPEECWAAGVLAGIAIGRAHALDSDLARASEAAADKPLWSWAD